MNAILPRRTVLQRVSCVRGGKVPCDDRLMMNNTTRSGDLKCSVDQSFTQRNTLQRAFYIMIRIINENHTEAFPADTVLQPDNDAPREPVPDADLERAVARLHSTMGHPSNAARARAVRLTGGLESATRACLRHQCSVCRRLRVPGPPPAGSLPPERDFGNLVGVDLFELADTR